MGVWDFRLFKQEIDKWMKLAMDESLSPEDRAHYLRNAEHAKENRDRYALQWEMNALKWREDPSGQRSE